MIERLENLSDDLFEFRKSFSKGSLAEAEVEQDVAALNAAIQRLRNIETAVSLITRNSHNFYRMGALGAGDMRDAIELLQLKEDGK